MPRWFGIGIVLVAGWLQLGGCSGGVLSGGTAGAAGGSAGTGPGGHSILLGTGGSIPGVGGQILPTDAGPDPFAECMRPLPAPRVPPSLVIALDTSAAMNNIACDGCDTPPRWAFAIDAIIKIVRDTQPDANWGLKLFGDGQNACGAPTFVDIGPGRGTSEPIAMVLSARTAGNRLAGPDNRPARSAVTAATRALLDAPTYGLPFIVIVAAGTPNCAAGAADPTGDDSAATVDAIRAAHLAGIGTFVLQLGQLDGAPDQSTLENLSTTGAMGTAPGFFRAESSIDAQAALRTMVQYGGGCTFAVPPAPNEFATRSRIGVRWGDTDIPQDSTHTQGWDYIAPDQSTIQLYGVACDAARANPAQLPTIHFRCPLL